ncbi:hypothetical protein MYK68_10250 [Gordonia sp. PP30]|uniref:hypothetical protein n=1 Tax=Gordonia sp. PP30 TaxID=2935861 RepID=UPI001FFE9525|nr:hypothetical protein [Gordonia sp. PP30]UQE76903.1 hypothetical protein MYK68_10250 [Gordonia sp. PP30]
MKHSSVVPLLGVLIAAVAAVGGMVLACVAEAAGWRVVGALIAVVVPVAILTWLRSRYPSAALIALILIPTALFAVGITVVAMMSDSRAGGAGAGPQPGGGAPVTEELPADPQGELRAALDRADQLVPNGSRSVLEIRISDLSTSLRVYDPATGDAVYASRSDGRWYSADRRRATDRRTFSRADIDRLDLNAATPEVAKAAAALKITGSHPADGITLSRRSDDLLVAEYQIDMHAIQVDAAGHVAPTTDAAFLGTAMPLLQKVMRQYRLDPAAPLVREIDFMALAEGSSSVFASAIQNSGGVNVDFTGGPYESLKIVPGCFPELRPRNSRESAGFRADTVTTAALVKARDDLLARNDLKPFDGDLVAFQAGPAPGDRSGDEVIMMRTGPIGVRAEGVYALNGTFLRSGLW